MIVGVCGLGYTGSGAVWDYLKEFEEVSVSKDVELSFLYDPDGILDLENKIAVNPIRFFSGDAALKKFKKYILSKDLCAYMTRAMPKKNFIQISKQYIDDITYTEWDGFWHFDKRSSSTVEYFLKFKVGWKYLRLFDKIGLPEPRKFLGQKMYLPVDKDSFYQNTQKYIAKILNEICDIEKPILVLDQPFPTNNPKCCYKFFNQECKTIVVYKDPRDLYCFVKKYGGAYSRFVPSFDVTTFVKYYRYQMSIISYDSSVLYVKFEDLIYNYDDTTANIDSFLGLQLHTYKKQFFDPSISAANTQLYKKCLQYSKDVKYIEENLSEYLYDFKEQNIIDSKAKPFL